MDCAVHDSHFGGITLMLSDDFYIRLKAAILNLVFAGAFLVSPWFGKDRKPLIQRLFDPILALSEKVGKFKLCLGSYVCRDVWFTCFLCVLFHGGKYWGEFTAFGDMIVMFSFIIIQFIILRKHFKSPDA